jgi:hypothetical protein
MSDSFRFDTMLEIPRLSRKVKLKFFELSESKCKVSVIPDDEHELKLKHAIAI